MKMEIYTKPSEFIDSYDEHIKEQAKILSNGLKNDYEIRNAETVTKETRTSPFAQRTATPSTSCGRSSSETIRMSNRQGCPPFASASSPMTKLSQNQDPQSQRTDNKVLKSLTVSVWPCSFFLQQSVQRIARRTSCLAFVPISCTPADFLRHVESLPAECCGEGGKKLRCI